jgi:hypothetical protein
MIQPLEGQGNEVPVQAGELQEQHGDEGEEAESRPLRAPMRPTAEMVEAHAVSHLPFRSWCSFCVRGRGQSIPHHGIQKSDEQLPTISVDYGFGGSPESPANELPILIVKDRFSKCVWAHPVPSKGLEHPHGSRCLLNDVRETGYKRLILKSDQEPSIRALCTEVKNGFSGEIIPEVAPKENHEKSNGEAEATVKQIHGMVRTLREALQCQAKLHLPVKHPVLAWMIEHAGTLLTLFSRGDDGLTPFHRLKGRPWRVAIPPFGERVEFMHRTRHKLHARWKAGIFLGVKRLSSEKIVGDAEGIYVVQSVRRVDEGSRWDKDLLMAIKGTPWEPSFSGEGPAELPGQVTIEPALPEVPAEVPQPYEREYVPRRVYITKKNLKEHGYTAGCPACDSTKAGHRGSGVAHTEECRTRLEAALQADPQQSARRERAEEKVNEWLAKKVEENDVEKQQRQQQQQQGASSGSGLHQPLPGNMRQETSSGSGLYQPLPGTGQPTASSGSGLHQPLPEAAGTAAHEGAARHDQQHCGVLRPGGGLYQPPPGPEPIPMDADDDPVQFKRRAEEQLTPADDDADEVMALVMDMRDRAICRLEADMESGEKTRPVCEESDGFENTEYLDAYFDDVSGRELDPAKVQEARKVELDLIAGIGVWKIVPRSELGPGTTIVKGRWVDVNKGDEQNPNYRSRYVAKEFKRGSKSSLAAEFFAAMPPLSCSKFLLILAAAERFPDEFGNLIRPEKPLCVSFIDVKRAHFMSPVRRAIAVELPPELCKPGMDEVGLLERAMYGTRDAATCWEAEIADMMVNQLGFEQGRATPCNFYHKNRGLRVTVHGDDFETLGAMDDLMWFASQLKTRWEISERGILGPPGVEGTVQQVRHLNRIFSWTARGIEWEPDPRHVDLILQAIPVKGKVSTPLVKERLCEADTEDEELDQEATKMYQSLTMRLGYLSQDRPDLQRTVRELAKGMCRPTARHMTILKRAARYLLAAPRVVQLIPFQRQITHLTTYCDTDHAGCIRTRKSTSGVVMNLGNAMLRSFCRGQSLIALSSGEAEFYGLVSAASESLGEKSLAQEWGIKLHVEIYMDATAGAAIGSRKGFGRVKHIHTCFLWVQNYVTNGTLKLKKVHTSENYADILTKAVAGPLLKRMMEAMGFCYLLGRSGLALTA